MKFRQAKSLANESALDLGGDQQPAKLELKRQVIRTLSGEELHLAGGGGGTGGKCGLNCTNSAGYTVTLRTGH
jgi:hypothetical protein